MKEKTVTFLLILSMAFSWEIGTDANLLPRYLFMSLVLLGAFISYFKEFSRSDLQVYFFDLILILYGGIHFISIFWAQNSAEAVFESGKSLIPIGVYVLCRLIMKLKGDLVFKSFLMGNLFLSIFLILYVMVEYGQMLAKHPYPDPYLIKGLSSHKNLLSSFLLLLIPMNAIVATSAHQKTWKVLSWLVLMGQMLIIGVLLSRAVYVGVFLGLVFLFIFNGRQMLGLIQKHTLRIGLGVLLIVFSAGALSYASGSFKKFKEKTDIRNFAQSRSAQERLVLWKNSAQLLKEKPLTGVGAGNWKIHFPKTGVGKLLRASFYDTFFIRPHNDFLSIWTELGPIGLLSFLFLLVSPLIWFARSRKQKKDSTTIILVAGLIAFMATLFFDFPKERIEHMSMWAILVSMVFYKTSAENKKHINLKLPIAIPVVLLMAGFAWNLFSGYQRLMGDQHMKAIYTANDKGQWKKMGEHASKAANGFFNVDPISNPIHWFWGVSMFQQGDLNKAEEYLWIALNHNPYNYKVHNSIAGVFNKQKDYEQAFHFYQQALLFNPNYAQARKNLAITYLQVGQNDKAKEHALMLPNTMKERKDILNALKAAE